MTTIGESKAAVQSYFRGLRDGGVAALRGHFAPDATWSVPGDLAVCGTYTGASEILDGFLAAMTARLDLRVPVRRGVRNVIADGDLAVAEWTSYAQAETGQAYQNDYTAVFRVRDGLITEVREYFDTAYAQRVLFGVG